MKDMQDSKIFCISFFMNDIFLDSRKVKKNDYFISLRGNKDDGIYHLKEIIKKGGKLMYSDNFSYNYFPNLKEDLNKILIKHYKLEFKVKIIGITGTNKKTSVSYLLTKGLNRYGYKAKCISTIKGEDTYFSSLTTPRNDDLIRIIKEAEKENLDYLIMEVSSIGYKEGRVNDIPFFLGVLTSLESDHLDYHKNIFNYHLSKIEFIEKCNNKVIGINKSKEEILRDVLSKCLKKEQINEFLLNLPQVPGREEIINLNPLIIVDYAHTSSALEYILSKYKKKCKGKLVTIIGAGGNRDKSKRKIYGDLVYKYSDLSIITSDNPRNEDPKKIIDEIIEDRENVIKIIDREKAIIYGLSLLKENDTLLVLGKGNEEYIEIDDKLLPFNDKKTVLKYLNIDLNSL